MAVVASLAAGAFAADAFASSVSLGSALRCWRSCIGQRLSCIARQRRAAAAATQRAEGAEFADQRGERCRAFQRFGLRDSSASLLLVHGFMLVERLLDEGVTVAAEADEGLVELVGLIGVERELGLGQLELRVVVRDAGAMLAGGDLGVLGLDAVVQHVEPLRNLSACPVRGGACWVALRSALANA